MATTKEGDYPAVILGVLKTEGSAVPAPDTASGYGSASFLFMFS
jgi:hypothetical protein